MIRIKTKSNYTLFKVENGYKVVHPNGTTMDFKFRANAELYIEVNVNNDRTLTPDESGFEDHYFWS